MEDRAPGILVLATLAAMGIAWIGVGRVASIDIEPPALGAMLVILGGALHILRTGRLRLNTFFLLYIVLTFLICVALGLRGETGIAILGVRNLVYILAALCLFNMLDPAQLRHPRTSLAIAAGVVTCLLYSAAVAGIDILDGITGAISGRYSFGYVNFNFWRPLFNFQSGSADTVSYAVSSVNQISRAISVAVALLVITSAPRSVASLAVVTVAIGTLAINSTSYILFLMALAACLFVLLARQSATAGVAVGIAALLILPLVFGSGFAERIVEGDVYSRSSRVAQYLASLADIDGSILLGSSLSTYGGHIVHNFFLFSGLTLGLPGLMLASALYILVLRLLVVHFMRLAKTGERMSAFVVLCCTIFLIRITFGGAGGFADLPSHVAMAFALVADRGVRSASDCAEEEASRRARRARRSFSAT